MALIPNLIRLLIQQSRRGGGGGGGYGGGGGGYSRGGGGGGYGRAPKPEKSQWDYMETAAKKAFTSEVDDDRDVGFTETADSLDEEIRSLQKILSNTQSPAD